MLKRTFWRPGIFWFVTVNFSSCGDIMKINVALTNMFTSFSIISLGLLFISAGCNYGGCYKNSSSCSIITPSQKEKNEFLSIHNNHRKELGISQLEWDDDLAKSALEWGQQLARENKFYHSKIKGKGENLYWGSSTCGKIYTLAEAADAWGSEKSLMQGKKFDPKSKAGHYTQMIWRNTHKVGAAVVRRNNDFYIVAHYYPAGNWIGQNIY